VDKGGELHTLEVYTASPPPKERGGRKKKQIFDPQDKSSQIVTHFRSPG